MKNVLKITKACEMYAAKKDEILKPYIGYSWQK